MTASEVAADLVPDLVRINLSSVVSKYIGETEKNLGMIFDAAAGSDAVLFFDEADALFGKRPDVKDAHDRYANIEIAYLLQEREHYKGIVILASNRKKDIDQSFLRHMNYIVTLPSPSLMLSVDDWEDQLLTLACNGLASSEDNA